MILARLEPNHPANVQKLRLYHSSLGPRNREELVNIAIKKDTDEEINERICALLELRDRLEKLPASSHEKSLTDEEVQKLYTLITDEAEFPIVVYTEEFTVEEVTHEKGHEDAEYKSKIKKDIEENDALLRAEAALLIVDFGQGTKKYNELKHRLVTAITGILGNMLGEPDHLFLKEQVPSTYLKQFVEALYFIDINVAEPFMKIFNMNTNEFSLQRRKVIAS